MQRPVTGDDLPNELLLIIFPFLPLKALIASRGVNRRWRYLILEADLDTDRRRLLQLYLRAIQTPSFLRTRPEIVPSLQPFDREVYLSRVAEAGVPPRQFAMWVREWPAKAAIGWMWPGLSDERYKGRTTVCRRQSFANTLGYDRPWTKTVTYHKRKSETMLPNTIFHATTFLPVGIELTHLDDSISWGDGYAEEDDVMVSIEVTVMCVQSSEEVGPEWLVLDGNKGGEKMVGHVFKGGYGMKAGDIISTCWIDFLERELRRGQEFLDSDGLDPLPSKEEPLPLEGWRGVTLYTAVDVGCSPLVI